jgi:hypothetical protein
MHDSLAARKSASNYKMRRPTLPLSAKNSGLLSANLYLSTVIRPEQRSHYPACQPAYPSEIRSDIVTLMDPGESEPVRVSRGMRNLLAIVGVLLLVPSLAVVTWAIWNHAEPRGLLTIVPGGLLLGLILIVFAIRAGK